MKQDVMERINKQLVTDPATQCIVWSGYIGPSGHGRINVNGQNIMVHRIVWEDQNGPLPKGYRLHHLCGNKRCVNTTHQKLCTPNEYASYRKASSRLKMGPEKVQGIREDATYGVPNKVLGIKYGISPNHCSKIVHRRTWGSVTERETPRCPYNDGSVASRCWLHMDHTGPHETGKR